MTVAQNHTKSSWRQSPSKVFTNSRRIGVLFCVVLSLTLSFSSEISAQDTSNNGVKVAVIDAQRILSESIAVTDLSQRIEILRDAHQAALRDAEKEVRESDRNLALQRPLLDPSAYVEGRRALELQATTLQRDFQEKLRKIDTLFRQGMAQVQRQLGLVTQEIAVEQNLDLIFAKATVVLVRPDLDITDEALRRLNDRIPRVQLPELEGG